MANPFVEVISVIEYESVDSSDITVLGLEGASVVLDEVLDSCVLKSSDEVVSEEGITVDGA